MTAVANFDTNGFILFTAPKIHFQLWGFGRNQTHAIHIHEFGDTRRGCMSLGNHYNPTNKNHGFHLGDLIFNFRTNSKGCAVFDIACPRELRIADIYGRSVVIHLHEDDLGEKGQLLYQYEYMPDAILREICRERGYKGLRSKMQRVRKLQDESLKTGNAGSRMVCAVIGRVH